MDVSEQTLAAAFETPERATLAHAINGRRMPRFAVLVVLLLLGVAPAGAVGLDQTVPGPSGLTYFDLLRLVVTDLTPDGHGGDTFVPFRHIEGKDLTSDPPGTPVFDAVDVIAVPGDPARLTLLADFGHAEGSLADVNLLCLFALAPTPKLLDIVEVGSDRLTGLRGTAPELLAPRVPLILFDSEHSNSNQSYQSTEMIYLDSDRFRLLDTVFTFGDASCSFRRTQEPTIVTRPDRGPYRAVHVAVRETVTRTGTDCGDEMPPRTGVTTYQATYRWDAARRRFATTSHDLGKLAAANARRF